MQRKTLVGNAVLSAGYYTGLHRLFRPLYGGIGCVLMLHRVKPGAPAPAFAPNQDLSVTPEYLKTVIRYFREQNWDIVSLDEMHERLLQRMPQRRFVAFTFDDGYRDNLEYALPVFQAEQAPFAVYLTTGLIDRTDTPWWHLLEELLARNDHLGFDVDFDHGHLTAADTASKYACFRAVRDLLVTADVARGREIVAQLAACAGTDASTYTDKLIMTWQEVGQLAAEPLTTLGVHGVTHTALAHLRESRLRSEMLDCRDRLKEMTGIEACHFCYPYGGRSECGEREYRMACETGYLTATTTHKGNLFASHRNRMHALPRLAVKGTQQALRYIDVHVSGFAGFIYHGPRCAGPRV